MFKNVIIGFVMIWNWLIERYVPPCFHKVITWAEWPGSGHCGALSWCCQYRGLPQWLNPNKPGGLNLLTCHNSAVRRYESLSGFGPTEDGGRLPHSAVASCPIARKGVSPHL